MICYTTGAIILGFILDMLIGDPQGWPHLIRGFGLVISGLEKCLYKMKNKLIAGRLLVLGVLLICSGVPAAFLYLMWMFSPVAYLICAGLLCWQLLAAKSLKDCSMDVYKPLKREDIEEARKAVSMIVGRDTEKLDSAGITKAAVETVAENTSDGVAAPLLYIALGGPLLGCIYKAVNTMDSMVGYKNDKYLEFGRFAARFDDVLNYVPARICALVMIAVSGICGFDRKNAFRIWKRDRRNHASPNSAQTEAVMAGALNIQLAGDACYFGKVHKKPYIGDEHRPVVSEDIPRANRLLYATAFVLFILTVLVRGILCAAL